MVEQRAGRRVEPDRVPGDEVLARRVHLQLDERAVRADVDAPPRGCSSGAEADAEARQARARRRRQPCQREPECESLAHAQHSLTPALPSARTARSVTVKRIPARSKRSSASVPIASAGVRQPARSGVTPVLGHHQPGLAEHPRRRQVAGMARRLDRDRRPGCEPVVAASTSKRQRQGSSRSAAGPNPDEGSARAQGAGDPVADRRAGAGQRADADLGAGERAGAAEPERQGERRAVERDALAIAERLARRRPARRPRAPRCDGSRPG